MATNEIRFIDGRPAGYTKYTMMPFSSWRALESFAKYIEKTQPSAEVQTANANFKSYVEGKLRSGDTKAYGLFGKHPRNYEEAMSRTKFLYYDEYKRIKEKEAAAKPADQPKPKKKDGDEFREKESAW